MQAAVFVLRFFLCFKHPYFLYIFSSLRVGFHETPYCHFDNIMLSVWIKHHFNKIFHGELMKKFLFALCFVQAIYAMGFVAQAAPRPEDSHLVRALHAFGAGVSIEETDGKIFLEGTPEAVQGMLDSLNDLGELRKRFLPFDTRATVVNTVPALDIWDSFFKSLGINPEEVSSINIDSALDQNSSLTFSGKRNKKVANIYVDFLKEESSFFAWAASTMETGLVEATSDSLTIHYGRLSAFLASLPAQDIVEDEAKAAILQKEQKTWFIDEDQGKLMKLHKELDEAMPYKKGKPSKLRSIENIHSRHSTYFAYHLFRLILK